MTSSNSDIWERICVSSLLALLISTFSLWAAALAVCVWQGYEWAQHGVAPHIEFLDTLQTVAAYFGSTNNWLTNPQSWLGIHKLLDGTGLAVGLFFLGALASLLSFIASKGYDLAHEQALRKAREKARDYRKDLGY